MPDSLSLLLLIVIALVGGACVGSFLTVVIARLPIMLFRDWENDCAELKGELPKQNTQFNLALPRSHCPNCQKKLRIWHNIPLLSYCLLKGRCAFCQSAISPIYPLVECLTALLSLVCVLYWGIDLNLVAPLVTLYFFIALAVIDYQEQLLPDILTLSLLWVGLLWNAYLGYSTIAVVGSALGYLIPWFINRLFLWIRKKPGMGHGDFKCLAAIGAWVGLSGAIGCYVLAAVLSLLVSIPLFMRKKATLASSLPFGPFLCVSGWLWVNFGDKIMDVVLARI